MTPEEFDGFYAASFPRLVGQVYALCGNAAEANDCVQEAFVRAWDRRRSLDSAQSPEAWVRTVASRLAISHWRRARRGRELVDRSAQPDASRAVLDRLALAGALSRLPVDQRQAIVLHHLCDLSVADVAAEVGAPVGTIKARLSRGRAALAELLREGPTPRPVSG